MPEHFKPTPGYANCPKCFGWQIRDFTPRDASGWPTGSADLRDCDHCGGRGELLVKADPWAKVARFDVKPSEVVIDDAVPAPGWPELQFQKTPIPPPSLVEIPNSKGWPQPEPPEPSGWPSMRGK